MSGCQGLEAEHDHSRAPNIFYFHFVGGYIIAYIVKSLNCTPKNS